MTVRELIDQLEQHPDEFTVYVTPHFDDVEDSETTVGCIAIVFDGDFDIVKVRP